MRLSPGLALLAIAVFASGGGAFAQSDANLAAKLAALDKLCASGVFDAQECAQRHAALLGHGAAEAPPAAAAAPPAADATVAQGQVFRDPQGRYSAPIPDGWNVSSDNGTARISSDENWVMLIPSGETKPEAATSGVVNQIRQQYQSLEQANSGRPKIGGHDAVYATFRAVNAKGEHVAIMAAGIQAPGNHVLVFLSSAPQDRIDATSPLFLKILNGIRFAGE